MGGIIGYARISSTEQAENSNALEQQIERLRKAGAFPIFKEVQSGSDDSRPEFAKVMELVKRCAVQKVIFTAIDRMSRKRDTILATVKVFDDLSIGLEVLDQKIDTSTAGGKFVLGIYAGLAQMETDRLSERIRHGNKFMREKRKATRPPFGYKVVDDRYALDDTICEHVPEHLGAMTNAQVAEDWIATFFEFRSIQAALRAINNKYQIERKTHRRGSAGKRPTQFGFFHSGFSKWLSNPILRGHTAYLRYVDDKKQPEDEWDVEKGTHLDQSLLSEAQYVKLNEILAVNKKCLRFAERATAHPLTGLIVCGNCESSCVLSTIPKKHTDRVYKYYNCSSYKHTNCANKKGCTLDKIELAVYKAICSWQKGGRAKSLAARSKERDPQLPGLEKRLANLKAMLDEDYDPTIEDAVKKLRNRIKAIEASDNVVDIDILNYDDSWKLFSALIQQSGLAPEEFISCDSPPLMFSVDQRPLLVKFVKQIRILDGEVSEVRLNVQ